MRPPRASGLRFQRLRLENWKNFARVDIPLESRVFLVGPNASGKSNLLDAFRFLHDLVRVGGGFAEAAGTRRGVGKLRCLAARQSSDVVIAAQIGTAEEPGLWEYELHLSEGERRRAVITRERVAHGGEDLWQRPNAEDEQDPERLTQTYLEQINVNKEFREIAELFRSIRYLHLVPQLIRDPDRYTGRQNDPYGGDFLEQVARTTDRTRNARLRRIEEALRVAVPQLSELRLSRDKESGTPHLEGKYEHWRPQGARQTEAQFSDGTLRLIGLLWAALDGSGPLFLEEPELSLHPAVVRFLPQMFARIQRKSGRQVIVSTHSPDLLRDEGLGLDETLLLEPGPEGTEVRTAAEYPEIERLLKEGHSMADAVLPRTEPRNAAQLTLFGSD
jgi:predicted ATPase